MKVEGFSVGFVWLLGDEAFLQHSAVVRVEPVPEYGVSLAFGYSPSFEEGLAEHVEVAVVVDHVSFFFHG